MVVFASFFKKISAAVASLGRGGPPRMTPFFVAEFKRTLDKRRAKMGVVTEETTAKKGHHFRKGNDYKKVVSFFPRKHRVTPSVAAPGNTNPIDATVQPPPKCSLTAIVEHGGLQFCIVRKQLSK